MEQKQIEKLQEEVKNICPPEFDVQIIKVKRRTRYLLVIKAPAQKIDVYEWSALTINPLHLEKVSSLLEHHGNVRAFYCCGNQFVLYSPFNWGLEKFPGIIEYDSYGYENYHSYVGICENIDNLITALTEKASY